MNTPEKPKPTPLVEDEDDCCCTDELDSHPEGGNWPARRKGIPASNDDADVFRMVLNFLSQRQS